uniref:Uncharacterized protein n=1 Tax=Acrobeloides nanus TaxID=290746 RepID=A0A914C4P7_9BILA
MELQLQATHLFTVQNSSLNKTKLIWNNLRPGEAFHWSLSRFKSTVRQPEVYARMARLQVVAKTEALVE